MANGKRKWVSDIIGDDYKEWKNEFVILDAGTSKGKTTFCIEILGRYAWQKHKKILYLCNRQKLKKQIFKDVRNEGLLSIFDIKTYQGLQKMIQEKSELPDYDYIIADECHFFTSDAIFNDYTDIPYKYVMGQKDKVVILISATAKTLFTWMESKRKVKKKRIYRLEKEYSHVDKIYSYEKKELTSIVDSILKESDDSKIVIFCNSAKRIFMLYDYYGEQAHYYCSNSSNNVRLKKMCGWTKKSGEVYDCIIKDSFEKRILITTTALDNGINLKDTRIKHIFCELSDLDIMIQAFGRKRPIDETDMCTFYFRNYLKHEISGLLNINDIQLCPVEMYYGDYDEFRKHYGDGKNRDAISSNRIFYNDFGKRKDSRTFRINECRYDKYKQDKHILLEMKTRGFITMALEFLGEELSGKYEKINVEVEKIDAFKQYLISIEGKMLFADDREDLRERFEGLDVKIRYTGINTFNGVLEDHYRNNYACRFYNKNLNGKPFIDKRRKLEDGSDNLNRDKRYWILENRND